MTSGIVTSSVVMKVTTVKASHSGNIAKFYTVH